MNKLVYFAKQDPDPDTDPVWSVLRGRIWIRSKTGPDPQHWCTPRVGFWLILILASDHYDALCFI
jgi:hypothetical protein